MPRHKIATKLIKNFRNDADCRVITISPGRETLWEDNMENFRHFLQAVAVLIICSNIVVGETWLQKLRGTTSDSKPSDPKLCPVPGAWQVPRGWFSGTTNMTTKVNISERLIGPAVNYHVALQMQSVSYEGDVITNEQNLTSLATNVMVANANNTASKLFFATCVNIGE